MTNPRVRALLPVTLTGGHRITFGVWLAVDPSDLPSIFAVWWEPGYHDLRLHGRLANRLPVWDLLAAPVDTVVRDPDETPTATTPPTRDLIGSFTTNGHTISVLSAVAQI
jgi:hypothetical protein